jgi:hypothetical protein
MSKRIMQKNPEQCLQLSEQELESVVGGAVPYRRPSSGGGFSGLPLPRTGGIAPATTSATIIGTLLAGLGI